MCMSLGCGMKPKQTEGEHSNYTQRGAGLRSEPRAVIHQLQLRSSHDAASHEQAGLLDLTFWRFSLSLSRADCMTSQVTHRLSSSGSGYFWNVSLRDLCHSENRRGEERGKCISYRCRKIGHCNNKSFQYERNRVKLTHSILSSILPPTHSPQCPPGSPHGGSTSPLRWLSKRREWIPYSVMSTGDLGAMSTSLFKILLFGCHA